MGHASPQVAMRAYAYAMTDDADQGRAAVAAIAAIANQSFPCEPDVHPIAAESS